MNERIQELAREAGIKIFTHFNTIATDKNDLEKFAELIVLECVSIIGQESKEAIRTNRYMGDDVPASVTQWKIKEHFGIE